MSVGVVDIRKILYLSRTFTFCEDREIRRMSGNIGTLDINVGIKADCLTPHECENQETEAAELRSLVAPTSPLANDLLVLRLLEKSSQRAE
jgi:hypothetical protein